MQERFVASCITPFGRPCGAGLSPVSHDWVDSIARMCACQVKRLALEYCALANGRDSLYIRLVPPEEDIMLQQLVQRFLEQGLSRRGLMRKLSGLGVSLAGAQSIVGSLQASEEAGKGLPVPGSTTLTGTGGELVMAQAKAAGAEYLFTNPGSFEVGFFDAQPSSGIPLIMGLHEGIVISMADGYHRVSGKPAFVNVHVIAGTAQMAGQLYNASRDGSALVISAGMLDNEMWSDEGMLAPRPGFDQKEVPRQFTKICWEAREPQSLPLMLRRAFKVASTEPGGPVYLAMANYALEAKKIRAQILPAERFMFRSR